MANEIVGDNIEAEKGAFTFSHGKGEEIRDAPFVYCPNLISKVSDMVYHHERQAVCMCACVYVVRKEWRKVHIDTNNNCRYSGLTWHNGAIPDYELWIKLGGDKSHGSFKLNVQLMNIDHPNSHKNTSLVSIFKAGDGTTNLHTALDMYKEHVTKMQGMKLRYRNYYV